MWTAGVTDTRKWQVSIMLFFGTVLVIVDSTTSSRSSHVFIHGTTIDANQVPYKIMPLERSIGELECAAFCNEQENTFKCKGYVYKPTEKVCELFKVAWYEKEGNLKNVALKEMNCTELGLKKMLTTCIEHSPSPMNLQTAGSYCEFKGLKLIEPGSYTLIAALNQYIIDNLPATKIFIGARNWRPTERPPKPWNWLASPGNVTKFGFKSSIPETDVSRDTIVIEDGIWKLTFGGLLHHFLCEIP
ncbi:uncharacterized protein LOC141904497 [Tubulanus polymorphus]|uniref:uncharacterized protein LOC141904497 n=1 Tax=Tubulanus polymorphus TaxID=672921 RepID=UPI003DA24442